MIATEHAEASRLSGKIEELQTRIKEGKNRKVVTGGAAAVEMKLEAALSKPERTSCCCL